METYPVIDKEKGNRLVAFEIENAYVSRGTILNLLRKVEGVTEARLGGRFGSSNDIRVEFKYHNRDCAVLELFGDNSRYWIGPKNTDEDLGDISNLEDVFKNYRPPLHRALIGDLLTFRLFKRG